MKIDIQKIDEKIRKLQHLKELASDPEMRELLIGVVAESTNGNGNGHAKPRQSASSPLAEHVKKACLAIGGKFTVSDIVNKLHEMRYAFEAKDEATAAYGAMRRLRENGFLEMVEEGGPANPAKWSLTEHRQ